LIGVFAVGLHASTPLLESGYENAFLLKSFPDVKEKCD
jgi:hypothetical protein